MNSEGKEGKSDIERNRWNLSHIHELEGSIKHKVVCGSELNRHTIPKTGRDKREKHYRRLGVSHSITCEYRREGVDRNLRVKSKLSSSGPASWFVGGKFCDAWLRKLD
jgi:hypothetical protein